MTGIAMIVLSACSKANPDVFLIRSPPPEPLAEPVPPKKSRVTIGSDEQVIEVPPNPSLPPELAGGFRLKGRLSATAHDAAQSPSGANLQLRGTVGAQ